MVVTKSEEIANQLTGLPTLVETMNTNLTGKIYTLTDTASALNERIDKVNIDLTNEFKQYRTFIENEIQLLKDSDQVVLNQFAAFERASNVKVANVNDDLQRTKQLLQENTVSLEAASAQLIVQSQKIVSLEKACHRGLQHGRSFNVEIDGIPVNVGDEMRTTNLKRQPSKSSMPSTQISATPISTLSIGCLQKDLLNQRSFDLCPGNPCVNFTRTSTNLGT